MTACYVEQTNRLKRKRMMAKDQKPSEEDAELAE
jgi:hypothetical protein